MSTAKKIISYVALFLFLLIINSEALAITPRIFVQNDTDKVIHGSYKATILNDDQHTETVEDTFPAPPGRTATPPLPYYLITEKIYFTNFFENCASTVTFTIENRGGSFNILQPTSDGVACMVNGQARRFSGTLLPDGFTILLLEEAAPT